MFDHVTIRVPDLTVARRFYELAFDALDFAGEAFVGDVLEWHDFSVAPADADTPPTRGLHIGLAAPGRGHVDAFWRALTEAGHRDDGAPGPRPQYNETYYGGFVLDAAGLNSIEAVHHAGVRTDGGVIDHLWIRVADVAESTRFYETVAPYAGFRTADERPGHVRFAGVGGSFSILDGTPVANAHLAFPAPDPATVDAFHRAATEAGFRDNGPPGERAVYHRGYYGAYVLDPDRNNVESVFHDRTAA